MPAWSGIEESMWMISTNILRFTRIGKICDSSRICSQLFTTLTTHLQFLISFYAFNFEGSIFLRVWNDVYSN